MYFGKWFAFLEAMRWWKIYFFGSELDIMLLFHAERKIFGFSWKRPIHAMMRLFFLTIGLWSLSNEKVKWNASVSSGISKSLKLLTIWSFGWWFDVVSWFHGKSKIFGFCLIHGCVGRWLVNFRIQRLSNCTVLRCFYYVLTILRDDWCRSEHPVCRWV